MKYVFTYQQLVWMREHERRHQDTGARFERKRKLKESLACDYSINRDFQKKEKDNA
jgi:hypothetical protein